MKNTAFLFIALFLGCTASVNAQKNSYMVLNFGRVNFTAKNTPYTMRLLLPNGSFAISPLDIRALKGMNLGLGYEHQLYQRFSGALSLNGVRVNTTIQKSYPEKYIGTATLKDVTFPLRRKLMAGVLQAQLLFDFIKSEKTDLKLGFGGTAAWSHFVYDSYISLFYDNGAKAVLEAYNKTAETKLKIGHFFSYTFGVALPKSLYLQVQITQHKTDNHIYTLTNLGMGLKFDGMKNYR